MAEVLPDTQCSSLKELAGLVISLKDKLNEKNTDSMLPKCACIIHVAFAKTFLFYSYGLKYSSIQFKVYFLFLLIWGAGSWPKMLTIMAFLHEATCFYLNLLKMLMKNGASSETLLKKCVQLYFQVLVKLNAKLHAFT